MKYFYFFLLFSFANLLTAQDAYHSNIENTLSSQYNLPSGEWLIQNTETGILDEVVNYGGFENVIDITGQNFSKASQMAINNAGTNAWDSGWKLKNNISIAQGEKMLIVFWIRADGGGTGNIFVERSSDFAKEIYTGVNITDEWTQYFVPVEATLGNHPAGQLDLGFHLGLEVQTVQIGGFTAIKYPSSVDMDDLPSDFNNDQYEGYELDAPWRTAAAADRIDNLRKANLIINALTSSGDPISNAAIDIQMTRHEFAFGSAITAARIAGNNDQNVFYENKIKDLDGKGHGFNWVVFENDMKWDGWEEEWFVSHSELVNAVSWLRDRDIQIRGHNLVWPGWSNMPNDIQANSNNTNYIWNRIEGRLDEILNYPGLAGNIPEWDVLNEIVTNTSLEAPFSSVPGNVTGREVYADFFKKAQELDPNTKLYLNDYVTISQGVTSGGQYNILKSKIQELIDADAPIEGIGFQSHIGGFPNGIPDVLGTLDDFYNNFGLTAKITEFDMPASISEELGANYLRDFMTAAFSHESVDGFLFWNFWDGATWLNPGTNLFRNDWSRTPAGDMYVDLVFNQWWTDEAVATDANGNFSGDFFKGTHEITYTCNGQSITETINLVNDETFSITCDDLQTNIGDFEKETISVFPIPAKNFFTIKKETNSEATVFLFDPRGVKVLEQVISNTISEIKVEELSGVYFLEIKEGENRFFQKVVIR